MPLSGGVSSSSQPRGGLPSLSRGGEVGKNKGEGTDGENDLRIWVQSQQSGGETPITGRLKFMCSRSSALARQEIGDVSVFEAATTDPRSGTTENKSEHHRHQQRVRLRIDLKRAVSKFVRPKFDLGLEPSEIRTPQILLQTTSYLLGAPLFSRTNILDDGAGGFIVKYAFISDRLRQVRQEIKTQALAGPGVVRMLESHARFHLLSIFLLARIREHEADALLHSNRELLLQCLVSLRELYALHASGADPVFFRSEAELTALMLWFSVGDSPGEFGYMLSSLPSRISCSQTVLLVSRTRSALTHGRYAEVFRTFRSVCESAAVTRSFTTAIAMFYGFFFAFRVSALRDLNRSVYKGPTRLSEVAALLCFSENELVRFLTHCGLPDSAGPLPGDETASAFSPGKHARISVSDEPWPPGSCAELEGAFAIIQRNLGATRLFSTFCGDY